MGYFEEEGLLAKLAVESEVPGLKECLVKRWLGVKGEGSERSEAEATLWKEEEEVGRTVCRGARWASDGEAQLVEEFVGVFKQIAG